MQIALRLFAIYMINFVGSLFLSSAGVGATLAYAFWGGVCGVVGLFWVLWGEYK